MWVGGWSDAEFCLFSEHLKARGVTLSNQLLVSGASASEDKLLMRTVAQCSVEISFMKSPETGCPCKTQTAASPSGLAGSCPEQSQQSGMLLALAPAISPALRECDRLENVPASFLLEADE